VTTPTPHAERLVAVLAPPLTEIGLRLYDAEVVGTGRARTLRVFVDRDGGVDLDAVTAATEVLGPVLDHDAVVADALPGGYLLEVSSPGLERPLRTPDHFRGALGAAISLKVRAADGTSQRSRAVVVAVDDAGIDVEIDGETRRVEYSDVVQARTMFEWGPAPKPGGGARSGGSKSKALDARAKPTASATR
jgi:ribosome maturation factor RimP